MASTYLTRTMSGGSATTTKFTISVWVKRAGLNNDTIVSCSNDYCYLGFNGGNKLFLELHDTDNVRLRTNALLRDTNAWYHIVASYDSTQSTASDRMKLYVNGEQITSFNVANYPSQNYGAGFGGNLQHSVGRREIDDAEYFSGIISHLHLCAGYTYDASAFGSTDSTTGEWKINTSPSVTYGTNGFFILKDGNSVTDQSGNSNNFTASGDLTKTEDCPSNVFATLNPLLGATLIGSTVEFIAGNTQAKDPNGSASGVNPLFLSTLGITSGKYYWESQVLNFSSGSGHMYGLYRTNGSVSATYDSNNTIHHLYKDTALHIRKYGTITETVSALSDGDYIGIAFDCDNGTMQFYRNGSTLGSQITGVSSANDGYIYFPYFCLESSSSGRYGEYRTNFGNGAFGSTQLTGTTYQATGLGIFKYQPPTGFTALCTKGLNL